jgi:predicted double-glycine peptidase
LGGNLKKETYFLEVINDGDKSITSIYTQTVTAYGFMGVLKKLNNTATPTEMKRQILDKYPIFKLYI